MIWNDIELFNVEEIEESNGIIRFYRFPKELIHKIGMEYFNRHVARTTTGCEIRFVGEAMITLGAVEEDGYIEIFRGDFQVSQKLLKKGERTAIHLQYAQNIDNYPTEYNAQYSKDVWRIVFCNDFCGAIYDIDKYTDVRLPRADELPSKKILAYGSSITHSAGSFMYSLSYISYMAKRLNLQVLNKGMGGSCFCEKEIGDYIKCSECDGLFLELGVNMMGQFTPDEFYERASYIVKSALNTGKKTVLVSPYLHFKDFSHNFDDRKKSADYALMCQKIASENKSLIFIDGKRILTDISMLTSDLIHPSILGHIAMGKNLSEELVAKAFL